MKKSLLLIASLVSLSLTAQTYNMSSAPVTTCSGTYYDSGGQFGSYNPNQSIVQTFTSANGNRLSFNFTSFNVETCCDKLMIFDGPSTSYPLIGTYAANSPGLVVSSGSSLTFYFYSDFQNSYSGWEATISCTTAPLNPYTMSSGTVTACSGVFYDNGGPTAAYPNSTDITETFCSGTSDRLQFSFYTGATGLQAGDTLFIYDGSGTASPLMGYYVTNSIVATVVSTGTCLTFRLKSDATSNDFGWCATFTCSPAPPAAEYWMSPGLRVTCGGIFYDSGGPSGLYSSSAAQTMTFQSATGSRLSLNFSSFSLEAGTDNIYFFDGPSTAYPQIGSYSASSPGTVTSTGQYLTVYFTSNNTNNYAGWTAAISCAGPVLPGYTMSSGTVTSCSGVFYDPGGPAGNYANNANVTQTICSGTSDYLLFSFNSSASYLTTGDTLFVYDGASVASPLLAAYTYGANYDPVTSSGTCLTFRFKSDASGVSTGWAASFSCTSTPASPPVFNMSSGIRVACNGTFYDSGGGSGTYSSSENKTMILQSANGNRISLNFTLFSVEGSADYLYIYDGPGQNYPLIGVYSGSTVPGTINSSGTSLYIRFTSNFSNNYAGWTATISCLGPPLTNYNLSAGTVTACEGMFYDNGGALGLYPNSTNITQTFCSANGDHLMFTFYRQACSLNTEDTLFIYDGTSTSSPLLAAYIGGSLSFETIISSGPCLTFRFKSDATGNSYGWAAYFTCTTSSPSPGVFSMRPGIISTCGATFYDSGGLTGDYSNNENNNMTFQSANGNQLTVTFTSFYLYTGDLLYIYDGPTTSFPLIGVYQGSPGTITSTGNSLCFRFVADWTLTTSGWEANITCGGPALTSYPMSSGTITTCSGVFYDNGGGGMNYPNNENRVQTFTSASGQYLRFDFSQNHFGIIPGDSLFVYDGNSTAAPLYAVLTGNYVPAYIISSTNSFTFRFKSNSSGTGVGWQAIISCVSAPDPNPAVSLTSGIRYVCSGTFYDSGGPSSGYSNSENRTMTFVSNSGCGIRFTFTSFSTDYNYDFLYAYDGPSTASPLIGSYTGSALPPVIQSSGNAITFAFSSNINMPYSGWAATIECPNQPLSAITPAGPVNLCPGDSITLTAPSNSTYLWNTGATTQSIVVHTAGSYFCSVSNALGCTASSAAVIVTSSAPVTPVVTAGGPTSFCQGNSVVLNTNNPGSYLWSNNATNDSIIVTQSGSYFVVVTDGNGCTAASAPVSVTVNPLPNPSISANGPLSFCSGDSVLLSVSGGDTYLWSNSAATNSITVTQSGSYSVNATNSFGCTATSAPVNVSVYNYPSAGISASGPTTFCQGATVTLNGTGGSSYLWNNSLTGSSIVVNQSGSYFVIVSNGPCADTSLPVNITVNSLPAVSLNLVVDTVCYNTFPIGLSGGSPAGGVYSGPGVTAGIFDPLAAGLGLHTILYTYTDANNCSNTAQQSVYVDGCIGISDPAGTSGMSVAPNPAHTQVLVSLQDAGTAQIVLYDMTGRKLFTQEVKGQEQVRISLEGIAPGIYLLQANGKNIYSVRIVKE